MANDLISTNNLKDKIYTIRGLPVMLDEDLAELYDVETKQINRAVKRNIERFPSNFVFQLNETEYEIMWSQIATGSLRFQNGTLENKRGKHRKYLPYVFTEQGVAMLSGVLKSDTAVKVSISIMNMFVLMRRFISTNAQVFQRLDNVERKQLEFQIKTDDNFEKVFTAIEDKSFQKKQGIFFNGQVFDAYKFVSDLIRSAKNSIILIDNYVDDSVLTLFTKRNKNVDVIIYTKEITKQLSLDLVKYNSQYPQITIKEFNDSHDRFLVIDNKEVYHIGASLKDLGKRWFAFSKFDKDALKIMERL